MAVSGETDNEQARLWNGPAGRAWVETQELLDHMYKPLEDRLVQAVAARSARCVLDIGCGTGSTTLAVARQLGPEGRCIGVDISEPMIAAARARAERDHVPASFIVGDAQVQAFEPSSIDMLVSRFGVMFFDDPIRAFGNLRRAATDDAALWCIAWRSATENPFMTTAERAAAPLLLNLPPRRPGAPGQFAFADAQRVHRILDASGWADIDIQPMNVDCAFPETGLIGYLTRLGPVGLALQEADDQTRQRVIAAVRPAFAPYVHGTEVRFSAACWAIHARAGFQG
jgi:SAM-dependent methyltransferase